MLPFYSSHLVCRTGSGFCLCKFQLDLNKSKVFDSLSLAYPNLHSGTRSVLQSGSTDKTTLLDRVESTESADDPDRQSLQRGNSVSFQSAPVSTLQDCVPNDTPHLQIVTNWEAI